jgi:hypothetical protein
MFTRFSRRPFAQALVPQPILQPKCVGLDGTIRANVHAVGSNLRLAVRVALGVSGPLVSTDAKRLAFASMLTRHA